MFTICYSQIKWETKTQFVKKKGLLLTRNKKLTISVSKNNFLHPQSIFFHIENKNHPKKIIQTPGLIKNTIYNVFYFLLNISIFFFNKCKHFFVFIVITIMNCSL